MPRKSISSANAKHDRVLTSRAIKRGLLTPEEISQLAAQSKASRAAGVKSHLSKSARDGTGAAEGVKSGRKKLESRFGGSGKEEAEKRKFEVLEEELVRPIPIERASWRDPEEEDEEDDELADAPGPSTYSSPRASSPNGKTPSTDLSNYTSSTLPSKLTIPIRPKWHHTTTSLQLDRTESLYFSKWIAGIDVVHEARMEKARRRKEAYEEEQMEREGKERIERLEQVRKGLRPRGEVVIPNRAQEKAFASDNMTIDRIPLPPFTDHRPLAASSQSGTAKKPTLPSPSYFERNLHVWRQLWRVSEQSQIILVLLDARCPALHFPRSLRRWLRGEMGLEDTENKAGASARASGSPMDKKKKPKGSLSEETKARIAENERVATEKRRTHIPTKRVIIVLTKVDLVEPEVVDGWVQWCKRFWKTGERGRSDTLGSLDAPGQENSCEGTAAHEADDIDVICVSSYKDRDISEDTQDLKHRRRMPHMPPTSLATLFVALERAHIKLQAVPERFQHHALSPPDQKKKERWQRELESRIKPDIDWDGLRRGNQTSEPEVEEDEVETLSRAGDSDSEDTDPTVVETGSVATVVPSSKPRRRADGEEQRRRANYLSIGLIGQPNIGKSSLLNALLGESRVRASKTPGKTKHFQSIFWSNEVCVVDCPGLVMPSFVPMEMQAIAGILPISQISSIPSCINLASKLFPLEKILKLPPPQRWVEEHARKLELEEKKTRRTVQTTPDDPIPNEPEPVWTAGDVMQGWAEQRGFLTAQAGRPDINRAGNAILRMIAEGKIAWRFLPPRHAYDFAAVVQPGDGIWKESGGSADDDGALNDDGLPDDRDQSATATESFASDPEMEPKSERASAEDAEEDSEDSDPTKDNPTAPAGRFALLGVYSEESEESDTDEPGE